MSSTITNIHALIGESVDLQKNGNVVQAIMKEKLKAAKDYLDTFMHLGKAEE